MKKAVIYGAYGMDNLGDNYMMYRVCAFLRENGIEPQLCLQGSRWYFENADRCAGTYEAPFKKPFAGRLVKALEIVKWYFRREDASALIFMGGGYTNERFGLKKLFYMNLLARKFRSRGVYFAGQTVGPYKTGAGHFLLDCLYAKGRLRFTRESVSHNYLTRRGMTDVLAGDDAFLERKEAAAGKGIFQDRLPEEAAGQRLTLVTFKHFYGYEQYKETFFAAMRTCARRYGGKIAVIPFMSDPESAEYRLNAGLCEYLKQGGAECSLIVPKTVTELEDLFRKAEAVVTSAYHGAVLGYRFGCRVIGLYEGAYYRIKMKGLARLFHREKDMLPFGELAQTDLYALLSEKADLGRLRRDSLRISRKVLAEWLKIAGAVKGEAAGR